MGMNGNCGVSRYCKLRFIVFAALLVTNAVYAYDNQMNEGLDTNIPGLYFVGTWTYQGVGTLRLQYESGYVCYETSGRCYDYDASVSFRQAGSPFYGWKIYIDTFYSGGSSIWLSGFNGGGVKVYVDNYLLPLNDVEENIYFNYSPSTWNNGN
jgi:hypothetical protein